MSLRHLVIGLIVLIGVFMAGTLVLALAQDDLDWGWWWAVPIGGLFLLAVIGFRVAVQRAQETDERDRQNPQR